MIKIKCILIKCKINGSNLVVDGAAGNDPKRITAVVPASSGNNQTREAGYAAGWAPHPPLHGAPDPNPSRPSRPDPVAPRPARVQPGPLLQGRRARHHPPHGLHALRPRRPPLRRPEPRHLPSQARRRHDPPALLLPPRAHLPARALRAHAFAPAARRARRLH